MFKDKTAARLGGNNNIPQNEPSKKVGEFLAEIAKTATDRIVEDMTDQCAEQATIMAKYGVKRFTAVAMYKEPHAVILRQENDLDNKIIESLAARGINAKKNNEIEKHEIPLGIVLDITLF